MKILITNDDGIYSEGIYALSRELKKIAQITVVAPDSQRSSIGHAITLAHPIWYKKVKRKNKFFGYGVSGTPADCVKFATSVIMRKKPDMIFSGINLGPNDGCSVFYSGTVAGAREGCLMGIPSVAISLATFENEKFSFAAKCALKLAKKYSSKDSIPKGTFLNVNVPNLPASRIKGMINTKQCMIPIHGTFSKRKDPNLNNYYWMSGKLPTQRKSKSFDTYALNDGYVTITPIQTNSTDIEFLKSLE